MGNGYVATQNVELIWQTQALLKNMVIKYLSVRHHSMIVSFDQFTSAGPLDGFPILFKRSF